MRSKKPTHASIDEVRIRREGTTAVIEYTDPSISVVHLTVGEHVHTMTDQQILAIHNDIISAQDEALRAWDNTVTEVPPGEPQIELNRDTGQWVPQGEVLRCIVDHDEHGEAVIAIDDKELSITEFGRLLSVYAGWGMRIMFVPEELVHEQPEVRVREPRPRRS